MYRYIEIKRLPRHPHLSPLQHNIDPCLSSFLLYPAFLAKERNLMHRYILLRVSYLLQRAATHLSGIFHSIFSMIEKDTTKSLGLRGIRVLEPTSRLQSNREETNANGGTKWRQKRLQKSHTKSVFVGNKKFLRGKSLLDV